jgi:hypothetical protein
MRPKKIVVPAVQFELFRPPSRGTMSWPGMSDALHARVVEVLAQLLLCARGAAPAREEGVDD